jgi:hypothetical protein
MYTHSDLQCDVQHRYNKEVQAYFSLYNQTYLQNENKEQNNTWQYKKVPLR